MTCKRMVKMVVFNLEEKTWKHMIAIFKYLKQSQGRARFPNTHGKMYRGILFDLI